MAKQLKRPIMAELNIDEDISPDELERMKPDLAPVIVDEDDKDFFEPEVVVSTKVPEMEWVIFRNARDPGKALDFHYHSATHALKTYTLEDGKEYLLPREIVIHLEGCQAPIYKFRKNHEDIPERYVAGWIQHFVCKRSSKKAA